MASLAESAFVEGFSKSALMILVSEIGDKTFFIAAVMAMRHPQLTVRHARPHGILRRCAHAGRLQVLAGALSALWVMTALSAVMGWAAPALVRRSCAPHAPT
jgi:putative Ca2+/H+ antiporter (TMEM165/GDT1 family)